ncbi:hypothetical protein HN011_011798 [Eciton burchellii]|nr:hypothetical protein HN011_011798 [Eciton burchellii]
MGANSDLRSLRQLAKNSLIYSGMSDQERHNALIRWEIKCHIFVTKLAQSWPDYDEPATTATSTSSTFVPSNAR